MSHKMSSDVPVPLDITHDVSCSVVHGLQNNCTRLSFLFYVDCADHVLDCVDFVCNSN